VSCTGNLDLFVLYILLFGAYFYFALFALRTFDFRVSKNRDIFLLRTFRFLGGIKIKRFIDLVLLALRRLSMSGCFLRQFSNY